MDLSFKQDLLFYFILFCHYGQLKTSGISFSKRQENPSLMTMSEARSWQGEFRFSDQYFLCSGSSNIMSTEDC